MAEAPDLLLFLRHVKKVSVYVKESEEANAVLQHESSAQMLGIPASNQGQRERLQITSQHSDGSTTTRVWMRVLDSTASCSGVALLQQDSQLDPELPLVSGKIYTTMALPVEHTGLPVHINGDFLVSSDRRNLWEGKGDDGKVVFFCNVNLAT